MEETLRIQQFLTSSLLYNLAVLNRTHRCKSARMDSSQGEDDMRLKNLFFACAFILSACVSTPAPTDSGVEGYVTIGPMCPVMQINNPCPDQPYKAAMVIQTTSGDDVVKIESDERGYFKAALSPGEYILHPQSPGAMPFAADVPFRVDEHTFTRVDVVYDSGIR